MHRRRKVPMAPLPLHSVHSSSSAGSPSAFVLGKGGYRSGASSVRHDMPLWRQDFVHTVLNLSGWGFIAFFACCYVAAWVLFGFLYWLVDIWDEDCLEQIDGFNAALLFAIETETTIGYGSRTFSSDCSYGAILLIAQSVIGLFMSSVLLSLLFAKITRPQMRAKSLKTSKVGVIGKRDGKDYLMFRCADAQVKGVLCDVEARILYYRDYETAEGELIQYYVSPLVCDEDSQSGSPVFMLPWTVTHCISPGSPLFGKTTDDLRAENGQIVLVIEGIVASTGLTLQIRTSYSPDDLYVGARFQPMATRMEDGRCQVDWSMINAIETMPLNATAAALSGGNDNMSDRNEQPERPEPPTGGRDSPATSGESIVGFDEVGPPSGATSRRASSGNGGTGGAESDSFPSSPVPITAI